VALTNPHPTFALFETVLVGYISSANVVIAIGLSMRDLVRFVRPSEHEDEDDIHKGVKYGRG